MVASSVLQAQHEACGGALHAAASTHSQALSLRGNLSAGMHLSLSIPGKTFHYFMYVIWV